jgi:predicted transcriptional regulator
MHTITITLSDDRLAKLQEIAARLHISPEELARAGVEELLARPEETCQRDIILQVAASEIDREECTMWLWTHVIAKDEVQLLADQSTCDCSSRRSERRANKSALTIPSTAPCSTTGIAEMS